MKRFSGYPWLVASIALTIGLAGCQDLICLADSNEDGICADPNDVLERRYAAIGPVSYGDGVAYRVPAADRITLLRTNGSQADVVHIEVSEDPSLLMATPDLEQLLVLSQSDRTLTLLNPTTEEQIVYALGSPFDRLELSDDGRFAIAFYGEGSANAAIIRNTNEMAVIDLAAAPRDEDLEASPPEPANPQIVTLRSFGSRPLDIEFAPPFTIAGEERRVALVLSENYVTLLELNGFDPEEPGKNEIAIRFVQDASGQSLLPTQVEWTDDDPSRDDDMFAFVLVQGSDDIISLNLLPGEDLDILERPRIKPSLNQLTGGRGPTRMAIFKTAQGLTKLATVNSSQDMSIIDVATSDTVQVPLDARLNNLLVYDAINPDTDVQEPFALLYQNAGSLRTVYFVELATVEVRGTRAIDSLNLDSGIESLDITPDRRRTLILHPGRRQFSVLNLERRAVTPVEAVAPVVDYKFSAQGDERLVTVFEGLPYVGLTDLNNTHPTPVRLDHPAVATAVIPRTDTIVVDHGYSTGVVSLLSLSAPDRETTRSLWGFAVDDLLQVKE